MAEGRAVLFVHGHGPKPAAEALLPLWRGALSAGLRRDHPDALDALDACEFHLAYYADLFPEALATPYDPELDLADRRRALEALAALDKPKKFRRGQYERLPGKSSLKEFLADLSAPLARGLGVGAQAVRRRMPECGPYWDERLPYAGQCRSRVREPLQSLLAGNRQVLCISHGFGAVLTWDVLWALSQEDALSSGQRLHSWITLGAPLADDTVRARLAGATEQGEARYPRCLTFWHNLAAEDDYICHDETVANDFRGMLDARCLSSIEDHLIYNLTVRFGRSNPHSSLGYLVHPRCTAIVAQWLQR